MNLHLFALVVFFVVFHNVSAAELITRFGRVTAQEVIQNGQIPVHFEGHIVASLEADSVNFYRVSVTSGGMEYVIIEKWVPGLNCHHEYLVISIKDDSSTKVSPSFGECMNLESASFANGKASIKLRTLLSLSGKTRFETYVIEDGNAKKK